MGTSDPDPEDLRTRVALDGEWEFVTDPNQTGDDEEWYRSDSVWPDWKRSITLPHAWQEMDSYREYVGTAWYRRTVSVSAETVRNRRVFLGFDAVDYETSVWVNGEHVGDNAGGFLPFEFEVTDALSPGENVVCVSVTDPADLSEVPHGKQGAPWYTRVSGIWQSVRLEYRPETHVTNVRVTPDLETDSAVVEVDTCSADRAGTDLECEVRALRAGEPVTAARTAVTDRARVVLEFDDPSYWSPESPTLYDVEVRLLREGSVVDRYEDYFGMRSFSSKAGQFTLNGEPMTVRGVLDQGYYPETLYRPPDEETFEREIDTAKQLGFNLVRKHLKPAHPDFLEYADRRGMLVWEEPAHADRYTDQSKAAITDQIAGLLERDYNRPSVVIWGLFNEEWGLGHHDTEETLWRDEEKQQFLADLYRRTRERDPTRLVCDNSGWAHVRTDVNDHHPYFRSPEQASSWEDVLDHLCHFPGDNYATTEFDETDAPIVISEFGTWGFPDVTTLRDHYDGDPPWFGHDFLSPQFKQPAEFDRRFEATDLPDAFDSRTALVEAWQRREFVSLKHLVEQMRRREQVAGYVLTQLSDVEWEFNGVLDYFRAEKAFDETFVRANSAVSVIVTPEPHAVWGGEDAAVAVTVVNDTGETLIGTVECSSAERPAGGSQSLSVPAHSVAEVELAVPVGTEPQETVSRTELIATFEYGSQTVTTREPVTVVDETALLSPDATVFAEGAFASNLAAAGVPVAHRLDESVDVVFTDELSDEILQFASDGGAVVQFPTRSGELTDSSHFSYEAVPQGESWVGTASFFYQSSPLLADVCDGGRLGWEFEGLYPDAVATELDRDRDQIHVGYVEGWIENWGSPFVVRDYGAGVLTPFTFTVRDQYGTNPVATLVCNRLIRSLSGD